jgi:hypothetical protein
LAGLVTEPDLTANLKLPRGVPASATHLEIHVEWRYMEASPRYGVKAIPTMRSVFNTFDFDLAWSWFIKKQERLRLHRLDMLRPYGTCPRCAHELYDEGGVYCPVCDLDPILMRKRG